MSVRGSWIVRGTLVTGLLYTSKAQGQSSIPIGGLLQRYCTLVHMRPDHWLLAIFQPKKLTKHLIGSIKIPWKKKECPKKSFSWFPNYLQNAAFPNGIEANTLYCTKAVNGRDSLPKKVSLVLLLFNNRIALVGKEAESSKCGRIQSKDLRISGPCVHLNPVLFVLKYFSSYLKIIFFWKRGWFEVK